MVAPPCPHSPVQPSSGGLPVRALASTLLATFVFHPNGICGSFSKIGASRVISLFPKAEERVKSIAYSFFKTFQLFQLFPRDCYAWDFCLISQKWVSASTLSQPSEEVT